MECHAQHNLSGRKTHSQLLMIIQWYLSLTCIEGYGLELIVKVLHC